MSKPLKLLEVIDRLERIASWLRPHGFWRVCWTGETEDDGFATHYGPLVQKEEAERRMAWGMKEYPHLIYWLERSA